MYKSRLEDIAVTWLIAWGISYIATAIFAPSLAGDITVNIIYVLLGLDIVFTSTARWEPRTNPFDRLRRLNLFLLAIISIISAVTSWTGVTIWNIPFANKELFQVTMGFMDFVSAVFMLLLVEQE